MARKWIILCLTFVITTIIITSVAGCSAQKNNPTGSSKGMAMPVAVQLVRKADVTKKLVVSGQILGERSVIISPKISGKVAEVYVEVGSQVAAGDTLFKLDDTEILAQIRQAEAAVAAAMAKKKVAEQNREISISQFERYKRLYEEGAISADTYESYRLKLEQALSQEPEANLSQMEANLAYQRNQLVNTNVTSPIAGEVAVKNVEVGSIVSPTTQAITVVDLDRVKVQVSVGEQYIVKLQKGQQVKVIVPSVRQEPFTGAIANLSPAVDPKTKSFLVEIKMDNPNRLFRQGMFAEAHIVVDKKTGVLTVPVDAVITRANESIVFTVDEGVAKENKVRVGISDGKVTEIISGLKEGDRVIVLGHQGLVNGSKVVVQGDAGFGGGEKDQSGQLKGGR